MLKVEVILGIVASSIAITAFLARAIANVRQRQAGTGGIAAGFTKPARNPSS